MINDGVEVWVGCDGKFVFIGIGRCIPFKNNGIVVYSLVIDRAYEVKGHGCRV